MSDPTYLHGSLRIATGAPLDALRDHLNHPHGPLDLNTLTQGLADALSISPDLGGDLNVDADPDGITITFNNSAAYESDNLTGFADFTTGRVFTEFEGDQSLVLLLADGSYRDIPACITYPGGNDHDDALRAAGIKF